MDLVTAETIKDLLIRDLDKHGIRPMAEHIGVNASFLSDIRHGRAKVSDKVSSYYGYRKRSMYIKA